MSRFSWATVVLAVAVATGAWLAGQLLDAGPAATLAGVCAVFLTVGATGGSLRADLRLLVVVGPLFVVAMTLPRLLTPVSTVGALASLSALVWWPGCSPGAGRAGRPWGRAWRSPPSCPTACRWASPSPRGSCWRGPWPPWRRSSCCASPWGPGIRADRCARRSRTCS